MKNKYLILFISLVFLSLSYFSFAQSGPSVVSVTISSQTVIPNGSAQYDITVSASDPAGGANVKDEHALINYQGENAGAYRGHLMYTKLTDYTSWDIFKDKKICGGNGAGIAAIYPYDYSPEYMNLDSCTSTISGNIRTVSFRVRFASIYTTPTTDNDISGIMSNEQGQYNGWINYQTDFNLSFPPAMSGTLTPSASVCTISQGASTCNINLTWTTANPQGTSAITKPINQTAATGNNGGPTAFAVPYYNANNVRGQDFYLFNNSTQLAYRHIDSNCATGTAYNGTTCELDSCVNGATNPPTCTINASGVCLNGKINPPQCTLIIRRPFFKEN